MYAHLLIKLLTSIYCYLICLKFLISLELNFKYKPMECKVILKTEILCKFLVSKLS